MDLQASLFVHGPSDADSLARLVQAIDEQTMHYGAFDVTYLLDDTASRAAQRLAELKHRRPNVRIRTTDAGMSAALEESGGKWIVYLGPTPVVMGATLLPEALSRIVHCADSNDCDVVVGRTDADAGNVVNDYFIADQPRTPDLPAFLLADCFPVTMRRSFAMEHGLPDTVAVAERMLAATDKVAVLGSYPCVTLDRGPKPAPGGIRIEDCSMAWLDGCAVFEICGSVKHAAEGARLLFSVRRGRVAYWVDGEQALSGDGSFAASVTIDFRTVASGHPLPIGQWQVTVGAHGRGPRWTRRSPLPLPAVGPAVIDGAPIVPTRSRGGLALDVGGKQSSVVPKFTVDDVVIEDSVRGTELTAQLSDLAVSGSGVLSGYLLLDRFPVRADLVATDGKARLVSKLTGLAGTSELSTKFGTAQSFVTGLSLVISPVGQMSVVPTPPKVDQTGPAPGAPTLNTSTASSSVITRIRKGVPAPLEPAVRALARNKSMQRIYRRFQGHAVPKG